MIWLWDHTWTTANRSCSAVDVEIVADCVAYGEEAGRHHGFTYLVEMPLKIGDTFRADRRIEFDRPYDFVFEYPEFKPYRLIIYLRVPLACVKCWHAEDRTRRIGP